MLDVIGGELELWGQDYGFTHLGEIQFWGSSTDQWSATVGKNFLKEEFPHGGGRHLWWSSVVTEWFPKCQCSKVRHSYLSRAARSWIEGQRRVGGSCVQKLRAADPQLVMHHHPARDGQRGTEPGKKIYASISPEIVFYQNHRQDPRRKNPPPQQEQYSYDFPFPRLPPHTSF